MAICLLFKTLLQLISAVLKGLMMTRPTAANLDRRAWGGGTRQEAAALWDPLISVPIGWFQTKYGRYRLQSGHAM